MPPRLTERPARDCADVIFELAAATGSFRPVSRVVDARCQLIDQEPRSASVEAATPTELFVLSRARFDAMAAKYPALAGTIFERLAVAISKRLRSADTELRVLEER